MTETVEVTLSISWYGNEMHIVLAAILHGAHFASVQDGRGAESGESEDD